MEILLLNGLLIGLPVAALVGGLIGNFGRCFDRRPEIRDSTLPNPDRTMETDSKANGQVAIRADPK